MKAEKIPFSILVPETNDVTLGERCRRANAIYAKNNKEAFFGKRTRKRRRRYGLGVLYVGWQYKVGRNSKNPNTKIMGVSFTTGVVIVTIPVFAFEPKRSP